MGNVSGAFMNPAVSVKSLAASHLHLHGSRIASTPSVDGCICESLFIWSVKYLGSGAMMSHESMEKFSVEQQNLSSTIKLYRLYLTILMYI